MDYVSVDMLTSDLGLDELTYDRSTSTHYNPDLTHFYAGLGIYGAVRGRRGRSLLGVDLGFRSYLNDTFFLDTGIHFGEEGSAGL